MNYPYTCDGMLTLECQSPINQTLNKEQTRVLTALIAKDLNAVLKVTKESALVFCGAAFAAEQLLQPQFPIQKNITQYASAAFQGQLNADQILSIGANGGKMPEGLQPDKTSQNLLHLPFTFYTHDLALAERFEADLMHKGMVSPPTYEQLTELLQVTIQHANYMTYMDLVAMMHNHYEQLGLSHLWQVIETALVNKAPKTSVETQTNNHFFLIDHLLFTPFFTWPQFQQNFNTNNTDDYINWLMAQRLSLGAFAVHGLEIKTFLADQWPLTENVNSDKVCLGTFEKNLIKNTYLKSANQASEIKTNGITIVQLNHPQAGTVAISVMASEQVIATYYPVNPQGLPDIERELHQHFGKDYTTINSDFIKASLLLL